MNKHFLILTVCLFISGCTSEPPILGVNNNMLKKCPDSPNCVNSQSEDIKHFIEPIVINASLSDARTYILKTLEKMKSSEIIIINDDYIRVEFTSRIFKFIDDVEFYFPGNKSGIMIIHLRSASRLGYYDLEVNRKRVEEIKNKFNIVIDQQK